MAGPTVITFVSLLGDGYGYMSGYIGNDQTVSYITFVSLLGDRYGYIISGYIRIGETFVCVCDRVNSKAYS